MSGLARYDTACRALAAARSVDEVLNVRGKADALRLYARQANDRQMEIDAAEIRFRAERRIGELMADQREGDGLAPAGRKPQSAASAESGAARTRIASLAEMNIGKRLADRARRYADMPVERFEGLLADRRVRIEGDRIKVTVNLVEDVKGPRRAAREAELATKVKALPDRRYGIVLDDPEWRFLVRSRQTGLDRAADNHYPTSELVAIVARSEEIAATVAAPDCAWFRWVTGPFLSHGIRALEVGGFVYKTNWAWAKNTIGTGYWNREQHELLLLAVRGVVPCPVQGAQWSSLIEAPRGEPSAKPDRVLEMIETYFPNVPKIELNRRGAARPGWDAWGNEAVDAGEVAA